LALAGCSGPAPAAAPAAPAGDVDTSTLEGLIEEAKKEGSVRLYASTPENALNAFSEAFTAEYGIAVEAIRLGGTSLPSRFESELSAGTPSGEVIIASQMDFILQSVEDGTLLSFEDAGVADHLEDFPSQFVLDKWGGVGLVQVVSVGYIYNTNDVEAKEIPDSWEGLNSDRWRGNYCAVSADSSESLLNHYAAVLEQTSEQTLKDFGAGIGRWYPNIVAMNEAVAAGECQLGVNSGKFFVTGMQATGAPVEFAPAPTSVYPLTSIAIAEGAERPAAARLLYYFALSKEGNALLNGETPELSGPEGGSYGPWDEAELPADFTITTPEEAKKARDNAPEILGLLGL